MDDLLRDALVTEVRSSGASLIAKAACIPFRCGGNHELHAPAGIATTSLLVCYFDKRFQRAFGRTPKELRAGAVR